jgi:branched-chain amino acid transport system ATP-binding protein
VLLVDELSLGLAPLLVTRLLAAVRAAADDEGVGVLMVEQHVSQALAASDYVYALSRGRVAAHGTVDEVAPLLMATYLSDGALKERA